MAGFEGEVIGRLMDGVGVIGLGVFGLVKTLFQGDSLCEMNKKCNYTAEVKEG